MKTSADFKVTVTIFSKVVDLVMKKNFCYIFSVLNLGSIGYRTLRVLCIKFGFSLRSELTSIPKYKIEHLVGFINTEGKSLEVSLADKKFNINYLKEIRTLKSIRLSKGLPVNGQRTHSNGETCKTLRTNKNSSILKKNEKKNK